MESTPRMTWEQICTAYPGEYVILDDLVIDPVLRRVSEGRVLAHAPTRREAFAAAPKAEIGAERALKFTGPVRVPPGFVGLFGVE
jgi:hypothetical protein